MSWTIASCRELICKFPSSAFTRKPPTLPPGSQCRRRGGGLKSITRFCQRPSTANANDLRVGTFGDQSMRCQPYAFHAQRRRLDDQYLAHECFYERRITSNHGKSVTTSTGRSFDRLYDLACRFYIALRASAETKSIGRLRLFSANRFGATRRGPCAVRVESVARFSSQLHLRR